MFRRYLERTNLKVVGVKEPEEVLPLARQLQPQVITLDVMMPTIDGWEILQALQTDPETQHIPVIVCSVWDEPELAYSLGAVDFLRKPISQKDLLDALARLDLKM
jgi:CheY-like chemotaxis protein